MAIAAKKGTHEMATVKVKDYYNQLWVHANFGLLLLTMHCNLNSKHLTRNITTADLQKPPGQQGKWA